MAKWRHLIVVLPGIGGSVLTRPGRPGDVVWDAGKGDIADLVLRPGRMSLAESPHLEPRGLIESTKFLGFTVVAGYEGLLTQLESRGKLDRAGDGDRAGALTADWQAAIDAMAHPAARAELRTAWARRLSASEGSQQAWDQLRHGVADANSPALEERPQDRMSIILTMRARQAVRALTQDLGSPATTDGFPVWARAPIPDADLELANAYGQAADWPATETVLHDHTEILTSPRFRTTLTALAGLHLTNPVPDQLLGLLDEIDQSGLDATVARRRADHQRRALLTEWISTPTWTESLDFHRRHHSELATPNTRAILTDTDDDTARQHLAILDLSAVMPVERVYTLITNPGTAEDTAFHALEQGDLPQLAAIATAAASTLHTRPTTWELIQAVLLLAANQPDPAHDLAHQLAEHINPLQRRAHTIRLRALRTAHPGLPGLDELIEIINPEHPRPDHPL